MEHFILMSAVKSAGSGNQEDIQNDLKSVIGVINKIHKNNFITSLDMVMINEFQGITNSLQATLEMIFDIEECIIENNLDFKLKHVLYHDTLESIQSKHSAYERLGFGLIDARQRLDLIKKTDCRFLIATSDEKVSLYLNNLFMIYEDYLDSWKKGDLEYVKAFLNNLDYKEVSSLFNINISSGWRREKSLKMKQYYTIKEMILSVAH
jgi:hypothetical protein